MLQKLFADWQKLLSVECNFCFSQTKTGIVNLFKAVYLFQEPVLLFQWIVFKLPTVVNLITIY